MQQFDVKLVWGEGFLCSPTLFFHLAGDGCRLEHLFQKLFVPRFREVPLFAEPQHMGFVVGDGCGGEHPGCVGFKVVEFGIALQAFLGEVGTANQSVAHAGSEAVEDVTLGVEELCFVGFVFAEQANLNF